MTQYLVILLALTQIPIVFIFTTRLICQLTNYQAFKKNSEWIQASPEFKPHTWFNTSITVLAYLLAAASFLSIVKFVFISPEPKYYIALLMMPNIVWTVGIFVYAVLFQLLVVKKIPAQAVRTASLENRRLSAYVPMWIVYLSGVLLTLIFMTYGWAFFYSIIEPELALRRLIGLSGSLIIGIFVLFIMLRRKQSELEIVMGSNGRKVEVRMCIALFYFTVFVGVYRIYDDFFNVSLFADALFFVVISFVIQVGFLIFGLNRNVKSLCEQYSETYLHSKIN
jgi:hypothetical protein